MSDNETNNIFSTLPQDILHQIFTRLPLNQIIICRSVNKTLYSTLSSPSFTHLLPPTPLLALRPPLRHPLPSPPSLHLFNPLPSSPSPSLPWLRFPLHFLPFPSPLPITSARGLLYLWADHHHHHNNNINNNNNIHTHNNNNNIHTHNNNNIHTHNNNNNGSSNNNNNNINGNKVLVVCNPLTLQYKTLPQLGSAWSKHGSVLVDSVNDRVIVLNELAALYYSSVTNSWLKFSSNLPSKPRSPVLVNEMVIALCDVGSPWRSQWKLFVCGLKGLRMSQPWNTLEKAEWGDVFDILKRPRLLRGDGDVVLMIGGLKSSFSLNAGCSTILILKLDLGSLEWGEAGRMPVEMFRCFQESSKFKVFGGGNRVCFSGKRVGRLALWEAGENGKEEWRWIDGVPGNGDGLYRGFLFDARLDAVP